MWKLRLANIYTGMNQMQFNLLENICSDVQNNRHILPYIIQIQRKHILSFISKKIFYFENS